MTAKSTQLFLDVETWSPHDEEGAALSPFTARVSSIATWFPGEADVSTASVLHRAQLDSGQPSLGEHALLQYLDTRLAEAELLVTFNGRRFDLPVLIHRYIAREMAVPAILLASILQKPWTSEPHRDLYQSVTFGGAIRTGTLDAVCECYGLPSPKRSFDGAEAAALVRGWMLNPPASDAEIEHMEQDRLALEAYNAEDVRSLARVYKRLRKVGAL